MHRRMAGKCLIAAVLLGLAPLAASAAEAPLADAVQQRDGAAVDRLLDERADVNAAQVDGMTALHWAAYNDDADLVGRLLDAGADAHARNRYGVFPLALAAENGNAAMVRRLLEAGADAGATLPGGETVLMTAARSGRVGVVRALVAYGADVEASEPRRRQTALLWAAAEGHADRRRDADRGGGRLHHPPRLGLHGAPLRGAGGAPRRGPPAPRRRRRRQRRGRRGRPGGADVPHRAAGPGRHHAAASRGDQRPLGRGGGAARGRRRPERGRPRIHGAAHHPQGAQAGRGRQRSPPPTGPGA